MTIGFALCVMMALTVASPHYPEWDSFKRQYGKAFESPEEETERRRNFDDTLAYIRHHNNLFSLGLSTFQMGVNRFADMTTREVNEQMNRLRIDLDKHSESVYRVHNETLPDTVDWGTRGAVTPVKNEGECAACWAFSATGSLEGQHAIASGSLVSLSEQQLVDCSRHYHNNGCQGGLIDGAFQYIVDNGGIETESSYPYLARNGLCHYNSNCRAATMSRFIDVARNSERALQWAIAAVGPVSVAVDAGHRSFHHYKRGVYYEPACALSVNRAVLAVGYGALGGAQYYTVKNSWGTDWGNAGYIWMARNRDNNCGIARLASFPVV